MKRITRRTFLKYLAAGSLAAGVSAGLSYGTIFEPRAVQVVQQQIVLPGLAPGMHGLRVVQISDLHMGEFLGCAQYEYVARVILAQKPDLILITGDYLTNGGDLDVGLSDLEATLSGLPGAAPVMTSFGNHDHNQAGTALSQLIDKMGFHELQNAIQPFKRGGDVLYIAGVDSLIMELQDLDRVIQAAPQDAPVILLAHEPDIADASAAAGKFALQLSGHTHGGQVILPALGQVVLPFMGQKYPSGLYKVKDMLVYTNRGIGMDHLPLRINCPPEITVFTLLSPNA